MATIHKCDFCGGVWAYSEMRRLTLEGTLTSFDICPNCIEPVIISLRNWKNT